MTLGRPPHYVTPEDLQEAVDKWLKDTAPCERTVTGLALYLGFASRQSVHDLAARGDDFSYVIKRAQLWVENAYELKLTGPNAAGPIFALKQMGWRDQQDLHHTGDAYSALIAGAHADNGGDSQ